MTLFDHRAGLTHVVEFDDSGTYVRAICHTPTEAQRDSGHLYFWHDLERNHLDITTQEVVTCLLCLSL